MFLSYLFVLAQSKPAISAGSALARLIAHPITILGAVCSPVVHTIKKERLDCMQVPHLITRSTQAYLSTESHLLIGRLLSAAYRLPNSKLK